MPVPVARRLACAVARGADELAAGAALGLHPAPRVADPGQPEHGGHLSLVHGALAGQRRVLLVQRDRQAGQALERAVHLLGRDDRRPVHLRVLHRRPDGYHELRTVYQTVSLADTLEISFRPARRSSLIVESRPEIPDNLVGRAAALLMESAPIRGQVRIGLRKRIPMGAGLGGGSSDAAAVLLTLPVLAGVRVPLDRLIGIAGRLGSDVPYFLLGGRAVGLGRGCETYPLPEPRAGWALLVAPELHVSTAEAYQALGRALTAETTHPMINSFQSWLCSQHGSACEAPLGARNDFEPVVLRRYPSLADIKRRLSNQGAQVALLSGSGSAVFGLFAHRRQAQAARQAFPERAFVVSLVSRDGYRRRWRRWLGSHAEQGCWPPRSRYAL